MTDIGQFVQLLEAVVTLQVSTQQIRTALARSRQNVWKADEALAKAIRKGREENTVLDRNTLLSLFDDCQEARDQLGPLEDSFQTADYSLVPKEDGLIEKGGRIARRYQTLLKPGPDHDLQGSSLKSRVFREDDVSPLARGRNSTMREPDSEPPSLMVQLSAQDSMRLPSNPPRNLMTQLGPLLNEIAPDLVPEPPWTQWTQFASQSKNEVPSP